MTKVIYNIVGLQHRNAEEFVRSKFPGEPLILVREPTNAYDVNAIQVWIGNLHIGYIKATQARILSMYIAAHKQLWSPPRELNEPVGDAAPLFDAYPAVLRFSNSGYPMAEINEE